MKTMFQLSSDWFFLFNDTTIFYPVLILHPFSGQEIPECFEAGECTGSLLADTWHEIGDMQGCLDVCKYEKGCDYFTYFEEDQGCQAFSNCEEL